MIKSALDNKGLAKWIKFLSFVTIILSMIILIYLPFSANIDFKTSSADNILLFFPFIAIIIICFLIPVIFANFYLFAIYALALGLLFYIISQMWLKKHKLAVRLYLLLYSIMGLAIVISALKGNKDIFMSWIPMVLWGIPFLFMISSWFYGKLRNKSSN